MYACRYRDGVICHLCGLHITVLGVSNWSDGLVMHVRGVNKWSA